MFSSRTAFIGLIVGLALALRAGANLQAGELAADRAEIDAHYAAKLDALAAWCDDQALVEQAAEVRGWLPDRTPGAGCYFVLERAQSAAKTEPDAPGEPSEFQTRFRALRQQQAADLFALAGRAARERSPALAFELITETAREDPEHKQARRLLGYVKYQGAWQTPFAVKQLGAGKVAHPRFGWLPKAHVLRYERGQRYYRNRWISAEEDARLHSDLRQGWQVESDHYLVTTNHSLEEGVALAARLEQLHDVWQQAFAGFVVGEAELAQRFAAGEPLRGREGQKHAVIYYRTHDQYIAALRAEQPQIDRTLGIYFDRGRTAYFFAGADQEAGTLWHEATHQLFQESRPVAADVGRKDNFWVIEAVACYMESLTDHGPYFTLGGADAGRLPAARERLLVDHYYVPLAELVALGMQDLQRRADLAKVYSQSSGLAAFLLADYREATVKYLQAVYSGRADHDTLARITGAAYPQLDAEYRRFLEPLGPAALDRTQAR